MSRAYHHKRCFELAALCKHTSAMWLPARKLPPTLNECECVCVCVVKFSIVGLTRHIHLVERYTSKGKEIYACV